MRNPISRQNRSIKRRMFLLVACFFWLVACRDGVVYHRYQEIGKTFWGKDEVYYFTFRIEDTATPYDVMFEIRNDNLYPYQNLWVFCHETSSSAPLLQNTDTLECILADEFGKWHGKGIVLHQLSFPIRTGYRFPVQGEYTFAFRQAMRNDSLRGIQEIGLSVKRSTRFRGV